MTLLQITLLAGLLGAILMFLGDMTLYYDKNDYSSDDGLSSIIGIMKNVSRKRLYIGGMLGPISAFLYCVGFYHIVLFIDERYFILGWTGFLVSCLGIICGGVYHSHCANLGLIGRHDNKDTLDEVFDFLKFQRRIVFVFCSIGYIIVTVIIFLDLTELPRWMFIFSQTVLIMFIPFLRKLPKGFHMILCGGWTNLVSVIYYVAVLIALYR
ncbi:DUF6796 family protein [Peptoniphilus sp. oral taxon 386]|uniref:DUF6796 family protein n=1 Tax=Peptoniphilus sp. oral taxon 386 TaxID=652713 RepID=UPI0001DA9D0C|nr:DUF6796 family protein [Peptoniphilus sp. oral taxon 386]EFI42484.1 hypothetical protein HMPREF0629_01137 [Peptoniphilus sp. oral taxon 386 str. F0131]